MSQKVPLTAHFCNLRNVTEAFIDGVKVDADIVKNERRLKRYVTDVIKRKPFLLRVVETNGASRVSKSGKYVLEGMRYPKLVYIPSDDEKRSNILRSHEKPFVRNVIKRNGVDTYKICGISKKGRIH